ncbi:MAG TPA: hypothetical protein VKB88_29630 [Bryobacteraceae bacterium]|nr:hypothetical protein [Bryobacteraceae bacterium]
MRHRSGSIASYGEDCLFNRYVGTSKGIERAAQNFSQMSLDGKTGLPTAIATWLRIGSNVTGITANVSQLTKPRWYDRLLGYGLNGVLPNLEPRDQCRREGREARVLSAVTQCPKKDDPDMARGRRYMLDESL